MGVHHIGDDLRVAHKTRHSMRVDTNPFCEDCGFRTFPQWGNHACREKITEAELHRIRHVAGDIISNLHFYRIPAIDQCCALAEALAFVFAANVHPDRVAKKWEGVERQILKLMRTQLTRQAQGTNAENLVMDVARPRMTARVATGTRKRTGGKSK